MTTLHEQYQSLLRRGMPEHPRLWWQPAMRGWEQGFSSDQAGWRSKSHGALCGAVDEADARDLVTMHAMRWLNENSYVGTGGGVSALDVKVGACTVYWMPRNERRQIEGRGPTILDAILAATDHLEAK